MTHSHDDAHDHGTVTPAAYEAAVAPSPGTVIRRVVFLLFGILQALLILRVVLLALGANEGNEIVSLVMGLSDPFVAPFVGMFDIDTVSSGESQLDVAALVALIGWTLLEALVLAIVGLADRRRRVVA